MAKGVNVTNYDAGGSGDNIIAQGFIKSVEKIWLDSYTLSNTTSTNTTIDIAILPKNAKVTSVEVIVESTTSQTSGTISIGFNTDSSVDTLFPATNVTHNLTKSTVSIPAGGLINNLNSANGQAKTGGFQLVTGGTQTTVAIKLNNWTMTNGTLKSVVRYT